MRRKEQSLDTERSSLWVLGKLAAGEGDRKCSPQPSDSKVEVAFQCSFLGLHVGTLHGLFRVEPGLHVTRLDFRSLLDCGFFRDN